MFDLRARTLRFFDATGGQFRAFYAGGPPAGVALNRWTLAAEWAALWADDGFRYLPRPRGRVRNASLQGVVEEGMGSREERFVLGYCIPLTVLVYCLCQRIQRWSLGRVTRALMG